LDFEKFLFCKKTKMNLPKKCEVLIVKTLKSQEKQRNVGCRLKIKIMLCPSLRFYMKQKQIYVIFKDAFAPFSHIL